VVAGGGRAPYVRIWDLAKERCSAILPVSGGPSAAYDASGGGMHVTSLTSAWPGTDIVIAGTSGGAIQVLDMRVGAAGRASPVVASLREHRKWIVGVCQARSGSVYSLVSGSVQADVRFWDLRRPLSVHSMAAHRTPMTALTVHDFAPLIATGSRRQQARVFTNSGDPIADIRYHDGFVGQRIGPVSSVAFHPHRLYMAVGALDSIVSVHHGLPLAGEGGP
jgi:regulator-associated protein of mTOR